MIWSSKKTTEKTALSKFKDWAVLESSSEVRGNQLLIAPIVDGQIRKDLDMRWTDKEQIRES